MNLSRPFEVVTPGIDGDVLSLLARSDEPFTGRQVHRLIGRHSQTGVNNVLNRLVTQGIVARSRAGAARTYRLNHDHLLAGEIVAIASVRERLVERLREELDGWEEPPVYAALFGSTARGDSDEESDIDLLLVHDDDTDPDDDPWSADLEALVSALTRWTGNDVEPLQYGEQEFQERLRGGDRFLRSIRARTITVAGPASYFAPRARRVQR